MLRNLFRWQGKKVRFVLQMVSKLDDIALFSRFSIIVKSLKNEHNVLKVISSVNEHTREHQAKILHVAVGDADFVLVC